MKKVIRSFAALVVALVALSAVEVGGQTNEESVILPEQIVPIGAEAVEEYAVDKIVEFIIDVKQTINRTTVVGGSVSDGASILGRTGIPPHFNSKQELDEYFRARLQYAMSRALTNSAIDKSKPCWYLASASNDPLLEATWSYFWSYNTNISFVFSNGQYHLPDLTGQVTTRSGNIPIRVPGIQWAICETFLRENGARVGLMDSRSNSCFLAGGRWNPAGGVYTDFNTSWLILKTSYISDDVTYSNKLSIATTNGFIVVGTTGYAIPERPVVISNPTIADSNYSINISGGDPGRVLILQGSDSFGSWTNIETFVNGYDGDAVPTVLPTQFQYSEPCRERRFFRALLSQ